MNHNEPKITEQEIELMARSIGRPVPEHLRERIFAELDRLDLERAKHPDIQELDRASNREEREPDGRDERERDE